MVKKRIIVLDDEYLIGVLMKEIVEDDEALEVAQVVTGKDEFLKWVNHQHFDAALVDISLGGCREGGIELLQTMRGQGVGHLPLVIVSSYDETRYALQCLQAGARGFLNKRYICTDVVFCLKQVIDGQYFVSGDNAADIIRQYDPLTIPAQHVVKSSPSEILP